MPIAVALALAEPLGDSSMVLCPALRGVVAAEMVVIAVDAHNPEIVGLAVAILRSATTRFGHVRLVPSFKVVRVLIPKEFMAALPDAGRYAKSSVRRYLD